MGCLLEEIIGRDSHEDSSCACAAARTDRFARVWGKRGHPDYLYPATQLSDINGESHTLAELEGFGGVGTEMTFMVVPNGAGQRMGVDRDEDGDFDQTEIINGTDPADPSSKGVGTPAGNNYTYLLLGLALMLAGGTFLGARRIRRTV